MPENPKPAILENSDRDLRARNSRFQTIKVITLAISDPSSSISSANLPTADHLYHTNTHRTNKHVQDIASRPNGPLRESRTEVQLRRRVLLHRGGRRDRETQRIRTVLQCRRRPRKAFVLKLWREKCRVAAQIMHSLMFWAYLRNGPFRCRRRVWQRWTQT